MMSSAQPLIDSLWDFDDPKESGARFRKALAGIDDSSQRFELQTQIARAEGLQGNVEAAHKTLDVIELALAPHGDAFQTAYPAAYVRLLLERGRLFNSSRQHDTALPLFALAHRLAHAIHDDHLAVDAAHMIAMAQGSSGHADLALDWNRRALRFAEQSSQPRARQWRASLHNNIGWTLHSQENFEAALGHFEHALACRIEEGTPAEIRIARWCVARCLRSLGRVQDAVDIQQSLLIEMSAAGDSPDGFVHEELGECLLQQQRTDEARLHLARAYALLSSNASLVASEPNRMARLKSFADVGAD